MIKTVQKGTVRLTLRDANQVAAFLNNGWKECLEEKATAEVKTVVETTEEEKTPVAYTKTEVYRMNKEKLVAVAESVGIENASEKSGTVLKNLLLEKLSL